MVPGSGGARLLVRCGNALFVAAAGVSLACGGSSARPPIAEVRDDAARPRAKAEAVPGATSDARLVDAGAPGSPSAAADSSEYVQPIDTADIARRCATPPEVETALMPRRAELAKLVGRAWALCPGTGEGFARTMNLSPETVGLLMSVGGWRVVVDSGGGVWSTQPPGCGHRATRGRAKVKQKVLETELS